MHVQQNLALDAPFAGDSNEPANRRNQNRVRRYNQVVPIRIHSWLNLLCSRTQEWTLMKRSCCLKKKSFKLSPARQQPSFDVKYKRPKRGNVHTGPDRLQRCYCRYKGDRPNYRSRTWIDVELSADYESPCRSHSELRASKIGMGATGLMTSCRFG